MKTIKKIVWRLRELPDAQEIAELVKDGILSKDEAREILFSHETEETREKKDLEDEIKFLRSLIEKLSSRTTIVEHIRKIEDPWRKHLWYQPYDAWCTAIPAVQSYSTTGGMTNAIYSLNAASGSTQYLAQSASVPSFTSIKTF